MEPIQEKKRGLWVVFILVIRRTVKKTVFGARFDVSSETAWAFENAMCTSRKVKLSHIIAAGGPELNNSQKVASCIDVRSTRLAGKLLDLLKQKITEEKKKSLSL